MRSILSICFFLILLFFPQMLLSSQAALTLPVYHIQIDPENLDSLYTNPRADTYYPAVFLYGENSIPCEVRFRGASSRKYPKKSWRILFSNNNNMFNVDKINLNAEYPDKSNMRNFLACRLFKVLGYPAPEVSFISFYVNEEYEGVFVQVEEIDENFLSRNGFNPNNLYKAKNHGANMSPLTHYEWYEVTWDKKIGYQNDYNDIQLLFNKARFWTKEDFNNNIGKEINIDNFLNYFAVALSILSGDNFFKNNYLYANPDTGMFEMFPWDNDASFGNNWLGEYNPANVGIIKGTFLEYHIIFQRLMENNVWRSLFGEKINTIITEDFTYLNLLIDITYADIKNDVYNDTKKLGSNEEFDQAIEQLHEFLSERANVMKGFESFNRKPLSQFYCSNSFPTSDNPDVVFRVKSETPQPVSITYIDDLDFLNMGNSYNFKILELFDDGSHNDLEAGDLIYGNSLTIPEDYRGLIPFSFFGSYYYYQYPQNGLFYINYFRTYSYALNCMNDISNPSQSLKIGDIYTARDNFFVEIKNISSNEIDISYCYLQGDEYYLNFLIPEFTSIKGNSSLIVASKKEIAEKYFENVPSIGNLYFKITQGDSVKLLSPALTVMDARIYDSFNILEGSDFKIVINEINYNSSDDFDTGDWLEFYNSDYDSVNISGWVFKDNNDSHEFVFPKNTILAPGSFMVVCRDTTSFHELFPGVIHYTGNLDFGLSGSGELVRLYNTQGIIIDSLTYDDRQPWPEGPDGNGSTLSLINSELDNTLPDSWAASLSHGTPGEINDVYKYMNFEVPDGFSLGQNYPNPFNQITTIPFSIDFECKVTIDVYNIVGQHVSTLVNEKRPPGYYNVIFKAESFSSGLYFYRIKTDSFEKCRKMILIK